MKLKVSPLKPILIYSILLLMVATTLLMTVGSGFRAFKIVDICILVIVLSLFILIVLYFSLSNYYIVNNNEIIHHKLSQQNIYKFKDINAFNEAYSVKHHCVNIKLQSGKEVYLEQDKQGKLFEIVKKEFLKRND